MRVEELRGYGLAFSDAESSWPPDLRQRMKRVAQDTVLRHLSMGEKIRFGLRFASERRRMSRVDLSDIRRRGMRNERFISTQLSYVAVFSALAQTVGQHRALAIMNEVMERTAPEALLLCLPEAEAIAAFDDPLLAFKDHFAPVPEASRRAGCNLVEVVEDSADAFAYDMTYCVWHELATRWGAPAACLPNCYADDVVFPDYFRSVGLEYSRTTTIAGGGNRCDFRLRRLPRAPEDT